VAQSVDFVDCRVPKLIHIERDRLFHLRQNGAPHSSFVVSTIDIKGNVN
jgi:hypothetical protein